MSGTLPAYERVEVCDGWAVEFAAPTLRILDAANVLRFTTSSWNPNMCDPRTDALAWAAAIADEHSGLTVEYTDDPDFTNGVLYVRANAPDYFADECYTLSDEASDMLEDA